MYGVILSAVAGKHEVSSTCGSSLTAAQVLDNASTYSVRVAFSYCSMGALNDNPDCSALRGRCTRTLSAARPMAHHRHRSGPIEIESGKGCLLPLSPVSFIILYILVTIQCPTHSGTIPRISMRSI